MLDRDVQHFKVSLPPLVCLILLDVNCCSRHFLFCSSAVAEDSGVETTPSSYPPGPCGSEFVILPTKATKRPSETFISSNCVGEEEKQSTGGKNRKVRKMTAADEARKISLLEKRENSIRKKYRSLATNRSKAVMEQFESSFALRSTGSEMGLGILGEDDRSCVSGFTSCDSEHSSFADGTSQCESPGSSSHFSDCIPLKGDRTRALRSSCALHQLPAPIPAPIPNSWPLQQPKCIYTDEYMCNESFAESNEEDTVALALEPLVSLPEAYAEDSSWLFGLLDDAAW